MQTQITQVSEQYTPLPVAVFLNASVEELSLALKKLNTISDVVSYEISCWFLKVQNEELWKNPICSRSGKDTYKSFESWTLGEFGCGASATRRCVFIARKLLAMNVEAYLIKELIKIGWSKAYEILRIATSLEDLLSWYKKAQGKTIKEVTREVKLVLEAKEIDTIPPKGSSIREQKDRNRTKEKDKLTQPVSMKIFFKEKADLLFFNKAKNIIARRNKVDDPGKILGLMAAHYLGSKLPGNGEEILVEMDTAIRALEETYGIRLAVVQENIEKEEKQEKVDAILTEIVSAEFDTKSLQSIMVTPGGV